VKLFFCIPSIRPYHPPHRPRSPLNKQYHPGFQCLSLRSTRHTHLPLHSSETAARSCHRWPSCSSPSCKLLKPFRNIGGTQRMPERSWQVGVTRILIALTMPTLAQFTAPLNCEGAWSVRSIISRIFLLEHVALSHRGSHLRNRGLPVLLKAGNPSVYVCY
jgi:hypothetical protein